MSEIQRQVLISHAADDPEWTPDQVEAVALAIQQAGIRISLDLWHQRDAKRHLSLGEWQAWMDESIDTATHILCLVSTRYHDLWSRKRDIHGGFGVAFESIRLIHQLYLLKQHNDGRILTLRPEGSGYDCIPHDLALDCPAYRWGGDRDILLSHVGEAAIPLRDDSLDAGPIYGELLETFSFTSSATPAPEPEIASAEIDSMYEAAVARDMAARSLTLEASAFSDPEIAPAAFDAEQERKAAVQSIVGTQSLSALGTSGLWTVADEWRAPIGDFPPPWASAWGDDPYGLWADLSINGATQRMRWIEPSGPEGFWMGSPQGERSAIKDKEIRNWANKHEHDPHRVVVADGFWLADTPCTQAFWHAVVGVDPSHFGGGAEASEHPVESVSRDAVIGKFIGCFAATPAWGVGDRICLPTELQWEYAARAGTRTAYWWGDAWDDARANLNFTGKRRWDDLQGTTAVRRYSPNPWGLYDMHGNVFELCADVWQQNLDASEAIDENHSVVRGGSWLNLPDFARAASRISWHFKDGSHNQGFRFALKFSSGPHVRPEGASR